MYKRLISLLLCLMLPVFPVSESATAESGDGLKGALGAALLGQTELPQSGAGSRPYLALYVDYQKTDEPRTTHATATLVHINSSDSNPAAQDIVIELKAEDTLELRNGSDTHVFFDDLPCGEAYTFAFDLFCPFPTEYVDPAPEPKLTITASSSNVGQCEYTCVFDSTTEPLASSDNRHLYTLTVQDISTCGSLLLMTFEEVRYTSGAARPMSTRFSLSFDMTTGEEVEITDILPHDGEAVNALVDQIEACLTRDHAADLFIDAHTAAVYATTKPQVTWSIDGDGIHVLYPADWITPRYLGSLDVILPFESLIGILDGAYLPSFPDAQGNADII